MAYVLLIVAKMNLKLTVMKTYCSFSDGLRHEYWKNMAGFWTSLRVVQRGSGGEKVHRTQLICNGYYNVYKVKISDLKLNQEMRSKNRF